MAEVPCRWIEPTGRARWGLRRFAWSAGGDRPGNEPTPECPEGQHDASVALDGWHEVARTAEGYLEALPSVAVPHDDPRWPAACARCGRPFPASDEWQVNVLEEWAYPDGSIAAVDGLRAVPPGAMWDARWMPSSYRGEDGVALTVQLPDGLPWPVDGPSRDDQGRAGPGWTRTGDPRADPPTVSATPSILTPGYHGFLTGGVLRSV